MYNIPNPQIMQGPSVKGHIGEEHMGRSRVMPLPPLEEYVSF